MVVHWAAQLVRRWVVPKVRQLASQTAELTVDNLAVQMVALLEERSDSQSVGPTAFLSAEQKAVL